MIQMNLKNQLQLYLQKNGISASQLSRLTDIPKQTLSNWLGGENPRDITQIKKVADYFGTTIDHLYFGDGLDFKDENELVGDDWFGGIFEVKIRKIRRIK